MVEMAEMSVGVEVDKSHFWANVLYLRHLHAMGECLTGQL